MLSNWQAIGWLVVVNFALYMRTLRFKFVSDDFTVWRNPPVAKSYWHKMWLHFTGQMKVYAKSWQFVRTNGKNYLAILRKEEAEHFLTILIHTAICIAIYFAFGANLVSFIASLLYSVNPVNNQGTMWPAGRGYALPILCLMTAMALPVVGPFLLYFCSWYTIGFLAPLALIGSKVWYLLFFMPFIWYMHSRKWKKALTLKHNMEAFSHDRAWHWRKAVVFFKTYGFYLFLCIVPFRITFYHNFLQSMAGNDIMRKRAHAMDRYFWMGVFALLGTVALAVFSWGPLAWALLAFFITVAPFCNVVRANQEIAERFVALPNVFLMFALAQVIADYPVLISAVLAFYATRTAYTLKMYKDEYFITEVSMVEDPHAWWVWHCRAMKRWETQSYKEALILWVMAKIISPKEFKVLMNIATCLRMLGNNKEADEHLELARVNIVAGQEKEAAKFIDDHLKGKLPILL